MSVAFFGKLTRLEKSLVKRYILEAVTKTNETESLVRSSHQTYDHLNTHYSTSMLYWLGNSIYSNESNEALVRAVQAIQNGEAKKMGIRF